jgi:hypothetical protein
VIPNKEEEFDLDTLSEYMIELKRTYPGQDAASVLMEAQIPYDFLIRVMDIVRAVGRGTADRTGGRRRVRGRRTTV